MLPQLRRLREHGIHDPRVLHAIAAVLRARFGDADSTYLVGAMVQALQLRSTDRVLEIGTGSGYSAVVLAQLARHVYTIERIPELAKQASENLQALGYRGVEMRCGDGSVGWREHAPFDAIIVGASAAMVPSPLIEQLAIGGRLVMPVERGAGQHLVRISKLDDLRTTVVDLGRVDFAPLVGEAAWSQIPAVRC